MSRAAQWWCASAALATLHAGVPVHGWVASTPPLQRRAATARQSEAMPRWGAGHVDEPTPSPQTLVGSVGDDLAKPDEGQGLPTSSSGYQSVVGRFTKRRRPRSDVARHSEVQVWSVDPDAEVPTVPRRQDLERWEADIVAQRREMQFATSDVAKLSRLVQEEQLGAFVKGDDAQSAAGATERWATRPLKVNLDLLNYHAKVARRRRQYVEAQRLWHAAVELDPFDGRAWLALARHEMVVLKNPARAREIFQNALQACPRNPYLLQALGVLEEKQGDLTAARRLFAEATRADASHVASWIARGQLEAKLRHVAEARLCYRKAVEANPNSHYAWHCLGMLERNLGNIENARALFARSVDANPRNAASYQAWAVMESKQGNLDQAVGLFRRALGVSPMNTQVMQAWACVEGRRGNRVKAVELFKKAIETRPADSAIYQAYAMLLKDVGNIKGARRLFDLGIQADAKHLPTYTAWAVLEAQEGNLDTARQIFQRGVWAGPRKPGVSRLWQTWACVEADSGNLQPAREYFKYALDAEALPPAITLLMWAEVEEKFGDLERARSLLEDAVRVEPRNRRAWQALADFERRQGREADAVRVEQRSEFTLVFDDSHFNDLQQFMNQYRAVTRGTKQRRSATFPQSAEYD